MHLAGKGVMAGPHATAPGPQASARLGAVDGPLGSFWVRTGQKSVNPTQSTHPIGACWYGCWYGRGCGRSAACALQPGPPRCLSIGACRGSWCCNAGSRNGTLADGRRRDAAGGCMDEKNRSAGPRRTARRKDRTGNSGLFQKDRLQHEIALVCLAIHIVVAIAVHESDAFDFGAFLDHGR